MDKEKEIKKWEHLFGSGAIDKALDEAEKEYKNQSPKNK